VAGCPFCRPNTSVNSLFFSLILTGRGRERREGQEGESREGREGTESEHREGMGKGWSGGERKRVPLSHHFYRLIITIKFAAALHTVQVRGGS